MISKSNDNGTIFWTFFFSSLYFLDTLTKLYYSFTFLHLKTNLFFCFLPTIHHYTFFNKINLHSLEQKYKKTHCLLFVFKGRNRFIEARLTKLAHVAIDFKINKRKRSSIKACFFWLNKTCCFQNFLQKHEILFKKNKNKCIYILNQRGNGISIFLWHFEASNVYKTNTKKSWYINNYTRTKQ